MATTCGRVLFSAIYIYKTQLYYIICEGGVLKGPKYLYEKQKYHTVGTISKFNLKITKTCKIDTTNAHTQDRSLSGFDTDTSIKSGRIKLVL